MCSPWNHFLSQYDGRYVRTSNVLHERIPAAQLTRAIRININVSDFRCAQCKNTQSNLVRLRAAFEQVLNHASPNDQAPWSVEIMHVEAPGPLEVFIPTQKRLPNLRELHLRTNYFPDKFLSTTPPLSILAGTHWASSKLKRMDLSKLTTLTLQINSPASLTELCVPSLIHVALETRWRDLDPNKALYWLKVHGGNLETFYWIHTDVLPITSSNVDNIWSLCPRLQRLLPRRAEWTPPPFPHKPRLLRLDTGYFLVVPPCSFCHCKHGILVQFSSPSLQFLDSGIHMVQLVFLIWSKSLAGEHSTIESVFCFCSQAKAHGIVIVDSQGHTFEQAVVAYLEKRKRVVPSVY